MGPGLRASRKSGPYAPDCTHMASLPDYRQLINRQAVRLAKGGATVLRTLPTSMAFSRIRTIKEHSRRNSAALRCSG
jgi:hypothetical protein